jgi:hypothetical protein
LHGCIDKFNGCIRMNATCSVNANVNCSNQFDTLFKSLYQNMQISSLVEKYLPSLHNLMYNWSSSVMDLAPKQLARATLLRRSQTHIHFIKTRIWIAAQSFNPNWRSTNPNCMTQDNLESSWNSLQIIFRPQDLIPKFTYLNS